MSRSAINTLFVNRIGSAVLDHAWATPGGGGGDGGGGNGWGEDRDGGQARRQAAAEERNSRIVSQFFDIDDWETCDVSVVDRMMRLIRGTEGAAGAGAMGERFGMRAS